MNIAQEVNQQEKGRQKMDLHKLGKLVLLAGIAIGVFSFAYSRYVDLPSAQPSSQPDVAAVKDGGGSLQPWSSN